MNDKPKQKRERRAPEHYVNNRKFSNAMNDHNMAVNKAKETEQPIPQISPYITDCFIRIAEGLSHKQNFIHYTFRDDLVADGIENCVRAVSNYNMNAATRSGKPNAFGYYTGICFNAFLRRIKKEKIQHNLKDKLLIKSAFGDTGDGTSHNHVDIYGRPVIINHSSKRLRDALERDAITEDAKWPKTGSADKIIPSKGEVVDTPSIPKGFLDDFTK